MKKLLFIFLLTSIASLSEAQSVSSDKSAYEMLRTFYTSYMNVFVKATPSTDVESQFNSLKKKYCTKKLLNKLPDLAEQSDADPLVKAQDSNVDCVKNLSFKKSPQNPNLYIVSYYYIDPFSKKKEITTINVTVIKQNGVFMIDNVQ